jgi:hypothetical protein
VYTRQASSTHSRNGGYFNDTNAICEARRGLTALGLIGFAAMSIISPRAQADSNSEVQIGFAIAPVHLNMNGKNPALVGKGSYIVNAKGDCNGCHNSPDLGGEWADGHNPYFGQSTMVNARGYLGGGSQFGPFPERGSVASASRSSTPGT